jgi:hypothetical protein
VGGSRRGGYSFSTSKAIVTYYSIQCAKYICQPLAQLPVMLGAEHNLLFLHHAASSTHCLSAAIGMTAAVIMACLKTLQEKNTRRYLR